MEHIAHLFSEYQLKGVTLKNRITMPPMCMYSADGKGYASSWHAFHYATRAAGGTGLIIQEATGVSPEGRLSGNCLGIWEDGQIPGLAAIVDAVHANGAVIGIQLNHGGRKCEAPGVQIEAPSPIPFKEGDPVPREMSKEDIAQTVEEFKAAAVRADQAGYDWIQIHGAHGYLINQFLSPLTNKRQDEYGGSPENRVRFLKEVIQAIQSVWPKDKVLEVRVTAEDYMEGGNKPEDVALMLNLVKDLGVDLINVSTGGVVPVAPKVFPGYQVPHAEQIKALTGLPVCAGGLISDPVQADEIIRKGSADLVYIGRELLRNPYWALQASRSLGVEVPWPIQYVRAK